LENTLMNMQNEPLEHHVEVERTSPKRYAPAVVTTYNVPSVSARSEDPVELSVLMGALWEQKATIAGMAILGLLAGLGIAFFTAPTYRARASLELEGFNNDQFLREVAPISPSLPNASPENYLQNAVKLLESETLAKRVADKIGVQAPETQGTLSQLLGPLSDWIGFLRSPVMTPEERRIQNVQRALTLRTSLQSQVIELFYDAPDPIRAAKGANAAAAEFVNLNREARYQLAQDTTDWLNKQAASLKGTLESSNRQLQSFARSTGLVFAGKQSTLAEDRMKQVQDALAKAEGDRAAKQARYDTAKANPQVLVSDAVSSGPLRQYQTDLENLRRELAQLQTIYTPNNYKVRRVQAQIAETEKSISEERQDALERLRTDYAAAASLEQLLSKTEAVQLKMVEQQMENERQYDIKKSEVEATQRLYESMLEKVKEAGAASAFRTTNVRLIDPASVPSVPYSPKPPLNMALGFALGTMGGIGLALLRAGSDNKVKRPGELSRLEVPELGVIPSAHVARELDPPERRRALLQGRLGEAAIEGKHQDGSLWGESFRAVLTSILFSDSFRGGFRGNQESGRVLVITSLDVKEGKTTVVANLARTAAERNRRVLMIDADLRRPRLHDWLGVPNTMGLTDMLHHGDLSDLSRSPLESLVVPTSVPNLWILPSGTVDANAPRLLYSCSVDLGALLRRFRREFDLVLIDTPPMTLYADGRLLGRMSDGLVVVVRANTKSREELRSAYLQFAQDQIPVLGTILNDWKMVSAKIRAYKRYQGHYTDRTA
jgi:capsular exopolysaccharide synthesis family protein